MLRGDALQAFDDKPAFAEWVLARAGLNAVVGDRQTWQVGGRDLTVQLNIDRRYVYVLYLLAGWPPDLKPRRSLSLAEVYAVTLTGTVRIFNGPELSRFKAKALLDAGLVTAPALTFAPLPDGAPASAVETWELIRDVLEVRTLQDPATALPLPLVAPWLASWNGTAETRIVSGKKWLQRHGHITCVGEQPGRFGKPTKLWNVQAAYIHCGNNGGSV